MRPELILIVVPNETAKSLYPGLTDFGKSDDKDVVAIAGAKLDYFPPDWTPDLLLVNEIVLTDSSLHKIETLAQHYQFLYIAGHGSTGQTYINKLTNTLRVLGKPLALQFYCRETSDPFYCALKEVAAFGRANATEEYGLALKRLIGHFNVDWRLEEDLAQAHQKLVIPEHFSISDSTLLVWNDDNNGTQLQSILGKEKLAVSPAELEEKIEGKNRLLVLAELNWHDRKYSQFYGYDLVRDLIGKNHEADVAFLSVLARKQLQNCGPTCRLLVPIFMHFQLPYCFERKVKIQPPRFSRTKWGMIRNYYIRPDGIVDKLLHDLKKITPNANRELIKKTIDNIQSYREILHPEIADAINTIAKDIDEGHEVYSQIRQLRWDLGTYYREIVHTEQPKLQQSPFRIMIVEDDADTLRTLQNGLSHYFENIEAVSSGPEAFDKLTKDVMSYSAIIADMDMRDDDGFLQEVQGYDLIEEAKKFPHLALCMLTHFSKRALGHVQDIAESGDIFYQEKDPVLGLPPYLSYGEFAKKLIAHIKENRKYLQGPTNGVWNKGLLLFYYRIMPTQEGAKLWDEVKERVEAFLSSGCVNTDNLIPKKLFHVDTREFTGEHLKAILMHRLITLFYQYSGDCVPFEKGVRVAIGFEQKHYKQYFNSLLGFSVTCTKVAEDNHICVVQKKNLLPVEHDWLKTRFPENSSANFPHLIEAVNDAIESVSRRKDFEVLQNKVDSLQECRRVLKFMSGLPESMLQDAVVDLQYYVEDNKGEFEHLRHHTVGREIHSFLQQIAAVPNL